MGIRAAFSRPFLLLVPLIISSGIVHADVFHIFAHITAALNTINY